MRAALAAALAFGSPFGLAACASTPTYAGIPLAPGAAEPELQKFARLALAGDASAQLELGKRFDEGRGVASDPARACVIYTADPGKRPDDLWIYNPISRSMDRYTPRRNVDSPTGELALRAYLCREAAAAASAP
jgi:hypothetical protein